MSEQKNIEVVQKMYAAFGKGDLPAILEAVTENVAWGVVSQAAASVPWHLSIEGRKDVSKFFTALAETVEYLRFEPQAFAAGGAFVYTTVRYEMVIKKNQQK